MTSSNRVDNMKPHLLFCFSESIMSMHLPEIILSLNDIAEIRLVSNGQKSDEFLRMSKSKDNELWKFFNNHFCNVIYHNEDEVIFENNNNVKDTNKQLDIELVNWADMIIIFPATEDLISKVSVGICDTLLLSIMRSWNFVKPNIVYTNSDFPISNDADGDNKFQKLSSWGWKMSLFKSKSNKLNKSNSIDLKHIVDEIKDKIRDIKLPKTEYVLCKVSKLNDENSKSSSKFLGKIFRSIIFGLSAGLIVFLTLHFFLRTILLSINLDIVEEEL